MRPKWRKYSSRRTGQPQHLTRIISYKTFYKLDSKALWGVREGRTEHVAGWDLAPADEAPRLCAQTGFLPSLPYINLFFVKATKKIKVRHFYVRSCSNPPFSTSPPSHTPCHDTRFLLCHKSHVNCCLLSLEIGNELCIADDLRDEETRILAGLQRRPGLEERFSVLRDPRYNLTVVLRVERTLKASRLIDRVTGDMMFSPVIDVKVRCVMAGFLVHLDLQDPELQNEKLDEVRSGITGAGLR